MEGNFKEKKVSLSLLPHSSALLLAFDFPPRWLFRTALEERALSRPRQSARDGERGVQGLGLRLRDHAEPDADVDAAPDRRERVGLAQRGRDVPGLQLLHVPPAREDLDDDRGDGAREAWDRGHGWDTGKAVRVRDDCGVSAVSARRGSERGEERDDGEEQGAE